MISLNTLMEHIYFMLLLLYLIFRFQIIIFELVLQFAPLLSLFVQHTFILIVVCNFLFGFRFLSLQLFQNHVLEVLS